MVHLHLFCDSQLAAILANKHVFVAHALGRLQQIYYKKQKRPGSGGIRTHASEETGALNQRLRPLGHATDGTLSP